MSPIPLAPPVTSTFLLRTLKSVEISIVVVMTVAVLVVVVVVVVIGLVVVGSN